jgi:hypothetical protein
MQKTGNYNLNLFESTDPVKHEDINTNTELIDSAINGVKDAFPIKQFVFGSYAGSSSDQTINVGFTPKVVLVCNYMAVSGDQTVMAFKNKPYRYNSPNAAMTIVTNGFKVVSNDSVSVVNSSNYTYYYLALA